MYKRLILCGALACVLMLGLFAPDVMLGALDRSMAGQSWKIASGEGEYTYESTLENRVRALEAWQNGSTSIKYAEFADESDAEQIDIWNALYTAGLLPFGADGAETTIVGFTLSPLRVPAEYRYLDITCMFEGARLHVILDETTGTYLRIDFSCDPMVFTDWMQDAGEGFNTVYKTDQLMQNYAKLLRLGNLADLNYMDGELIRGYESDIENTLFVASMRYTKKQGLIMYKVSAKSVI